MKVVFTSHAIKDKFPLLAQRGFKLTKSDIKSVIANPEHTDKISDYPKIIVSKGFDQKHILRVVYKIESGIIKVITFYPAEKGRYY